MNNDGEYIGILDRECASARILVRRRRCKLRKQLASAAPEIEVSDVRNIIIDYCMVDRKVVDTFRSIALMTYEESARKMFNSCWMIIMIDKHVNFLYIMRYKHEPNVSCLHKYSFKRIIDMMNGTRPIRTDIDTNDDLYVSDMNALMDFIHIQK